MAAHAFFTESEFEMGDLVCVDSSTGLAVPYDNLDPLPVVGVALVYESGYAPNGRQWFAINGPPCYENDFYEWKDDLSSDFTTENTSYAPFNPLTDTDYITAISHGIAAVKKSITGIPAAWILLKEKTNYDWYLIR